jgi:hypothetical protein
MFFNCVIINSPITDKQMLVQNLANFKNLPKTIMFIKYDDKRCKNCGEEYSTPNYKWCKPCQINYLKKDFTNRTSGNEKIDNFIQKKQLEISNPWDIVFEWIPLYKFFAIKIVDKYGFSIIYSAQWEDGPLKWDENSKKYKRNSKEVTLKYSYNIQNVDEFLNEV